MERSSAWNPIIWKIIINLFSKYSLTLPVSVIFPRFDGIAWYRRFPSIAYFKRSSLWPSSVRLGIDIVMDISTKSFYKSSASSKFPWNCNYLFSVYRPGLISNAIAPSGINKHFQGRPRWYAAADADVFPLKRISLLLIFLERLEMQSIPCLERPCRWDLYSKDVIPPPIFLRDISFISEYPF